MAKGGEFILPNDELPDVFTVNDFNDEQKMIRDTAREVVAKTVTTDDAVKLIESKDLRFQRGLLRNFAEIGFLGVEVPEEFGGIDLGSVVAAIIAQEVAAQGSFACTFLAHTGIGTLPLRFFGTEEQKQKYLPKLVSGEWVAAYCLTETGAGSDAGSVKTVAIKDNDHYILNGTKIFVTNGGFADLFTVFAHVKDFGLTAFLVERSWLAVNVGAEEHKMGIRGSSTAMVSFDNVIVSEANVLGELGKGFKIALNILNLGRFKLGAACLGGGKAALEESLKYAGERKQFGLRIIKFGAIRQKLALMAANNYAMEAVVYRTAGLLQDAMHGIGTGDSQGILKAIEEFAVECSAVKVQCSEALDYIVDENVQIHGGSGFCEGAPERHYRDSRINRIFEGTNEINRMLIVGMLLKKMDLVMKMGKAGKEIIEEAMKPSRQSEPEDLIERLLVYLNGARKSAVIVCDSVVTKFKPMLDGGKELMKNQMVLMGLADCLIEIYKLESVLKATQKNRTEANENMTRLIFNDSLFKLEQLFKELLAMCSEGDDQKTRTSMIRRFLKFNVENKNDLCNRIVEGLPRPLI